MLYFKKTEFKKALRTLGVRKGSNLFVHSSLASLGKIFDVKSVVEGLLESVDYNGVVVMPTYTYTTWPKVGRYNPQKTIAETGILPNFFIKYKNVYRTIQGNHSICLWGDSDHKIMRNWVPSSFGRDSSIYQTIENNFYNLMIGTKYANGCSMFHCIEEELQVPYRYFKSFPGVVELEDGDRKFDFKMYVRDLNYEVDLERANMVLENRLHLKKMKFNYGMMHCFPLEDAYTIVKKKVQDDPFFFARKIRDVK